VTDHNALTSLMSSKKLIADYRAIAMLQFQNKLQSRRGTDRCR